MRRTFTVMPEIDQNRGTAQDEYVYNIQNEEARAYIFDLGGSWEFYIFRHKDRDTKGALLWEMAFHIADRLA